MRRFFFRGSIDSAGRKVDFWCCRVLGKLPQALRGSTGHGKSHGTAQEEARSARDRGESVCCMVAAHFREVKFTGIITVPHESGIGGS